MIAGVGRGDAGVALRAPFEFAAVHDDAAQRRAVAAQELGRRVDDDVRAVLDRAEQVRGAEGVVNHERKSVTLGDRCDRIDIRKVAAGVAERLKEDRSRVVLDRILNFLQVSRVNERCGDVVQRKRVLQKVVGSAVDRLLRYDVSAVRGKRLNRVGDRCCTGDHCQCSAATLKGCHSLLENALRRVGKSAVDVAGVRETEAVCCVLCVVEYVCCRLVNRNRSRIGSGVCLFLSYM